MISSVGAINQVSSQRIKPGVETQKSTEINSDFKSIFESYISPDAAGSLNEEELFAGLIGSRLRELKGEDAEKSYKEALSAETTRLKKSDGFIPYEEAALNALRSLKTAGTIDEAEGDKIYSEAFSGAQLDSNTTVLFDGRGGDNDPTKAVESMEVALLKAQAAIEAMTAGTTTASLRSLATAQPNQKGGATTSAQVLPTGTTTGELITPQGTTVDGADGFLWKPKSESHSTLAVLLPPGLTGAIDSLILRDAQGNEIERGTFTSDGTGEGGRTKYSFSKPGGSYGDNLMVEALLNNGETMRWSIPDGSKRYD